MRKINLIIVLSLLLISCGKNSEKKDEINTLNSNDCNCSELNLVSENNTSIIEDDSFLDENWKNIMKDGKLFTGVCIEKDQNDSIIKSLEFKNGWTVKKVERQKLGKEYIVIEDMTYDNLKQNSGFRIKFESDENIKYVHQLEVLKNGIVDESASYKIWISKSAVIAINERWDDYSEQFIWDKVDGLSFRFTKNIEGKISGYLKNLTKVNNNAISDDSKKNEYEFYIENATSKHRDELLEFLKNNLSKFDYEK